MPAKSFIAENGDKPVSRRECAERHDDSSRALNGLGRTLKWMMLLVNGLVVALLIVAIKGSVDASSAALDVAGRANVNATKIEALIGLRAESMAETKANKVEILARMTVLEGKIDKLLVERK